MTLWYETVGRTGWLAILGLIAGGISPASAFELQLPVTCKLGKACFLQQLPDLDPTRGAKDPFCRSATYDGHKGTDIRLPRMEDINRNVTVVAAAAGTVKAVRDGEPDRLVLSDQDRTAVEGKECGNGIVIEHGDGWETQYCHLKRGSISVRPGEQIGTGERIGSIGASGLAQFPHVHLGVRKDGEERDPFTGLALGAGCRFDGNRAGRIWNGEAADQIDIDPTQIIDSGFADGAVEHQSLGVKLPARPSAASGALVGWGYFINLEKGDRVLVEITGPTGVTFARNLSEPMERSKASYSAYSGKRGNPAKGLYRLSSGILRGGKTIAKRAAQIRID